MNAGGTIVQYPFGYICTFPSRRHLFRGERQDYSRSEVSLTRRCRDKTGKKLAPKEIELLQCDIEYANSEFRELSSVGEMMHDMKERREYRRNRYYQIYGEYPETQ